MHLKKIIQKYVAHYHWPRRVHVHLPPPRRRRRRRAGRAGEGGGEGGGEGPFEEAGE